MTCPQPRMFIPFPAPALLQLQEPSGRQGASCDRDIPPTHVCDGPSVSSARPTCPQPLGSAHPPDLSQWLCQDRPVCSTEVACHHSYHSSCLPGTQDGPTCCHCSLGDTWTLPTPVGHRLPTGRSEPGGRARLWAFRRPVPRDRLRWSLGPCCPMCSEKEVQHV